MGCSSPESLKVNYNVDKEHEEEILLNEEKDPEKRAKKRLEIYNSIVQDIMPDSHNQLTNLVMEKKGPSKVIQNGRNVMAAPVRIFEGTWVLGASGLVNATKVIELRGGTLRDSSYGIFLQGGSAEMSGGEISGIYSVLNPVNGFYVLSMH